MREALIAGSQMLRFAKYPQRTIKDMTAEVVDNALRDAGLAREDVQAAWFANSNWGRSDGQLCIRGQVALRAAGIDTIPIVNVENACAGGSTALHGAWMGVAAGQYEVALAVGAEKIYSPNRLFMFAGFLGGLDVADLPASLARYLEAERELGIPAAFPADWTVAHPGNRRPVSPPAQSWRDVLALRTATRAANDALQLAQDLVTIGHTFGWERLWSMRKAFASRGAGDQSPFMDVYSLNARRHMKRYGTTIEQLAAVAAKNHEHSVHNPLAQYRFPLTVQEVLADRPVSFPLTRAMCAPIGDGAAAVVVCSRNVWRRRRSGSRPVRIRASVLGSGKARGDGEPDISARLAAAAYERAGVGPEAIDVAEVHDATAFGELHQCETLGFCREGEGGAYAASGATRIGGARPVNPSGGLECRGHPIAASGLAQVHELVCQLRGEAGARQVEGATIGMAVNGGGALGVEEAAMAIHIIDRM
ncbi:MAG: thiolase family protein [Candidatus Schekmanbacteria bacterium]|nr:thiolase family protein [Candidatus Schekmanbacteria bacterium]